jgi:hypothetical protein
MADVCYNELHQREQHVLWESQVERRNAGHVIREQEIETVDGGCNACFRSMVMNRHPPKESKTTNDSVT